MNENLSEDAKLQLQHRRFRRLMRILEDILATELTDTYSIKLHYFRYLTSIVELNRKNQELGFNYTTEGAEAAAFLEQEIPLAKNRNIDDITGFIDKIPNADIRRRAQSSLLFLSKYNDTELFTKGAGQVNKPTEALDSGNILNADRWNYPLKDRVVKPFSEKSSRLPASSLLCYAIISGVGLATLGGLFFLIKLRHKRLASKKVNLQSQPKHGVDQRAK